MTSSGELRPPGAGGSGGGGGPLPGLGGIGGLGGSACTTSDNAVITVQAEACAT
jgi:hypothetical protein